MSDDLEERLSRLEAEHGLSDVPVDTEDDSEEWPNPWGWSWNHRAVDENMSGSGFDFGVDLEGDVVIHRNGHSKCVDPGKLLRVLVEAWEEVDD